MQGGDVKIASIVPLSTVDWPGMLTAVVFLQGCPLRCTYCHNPQILDPRAQPENERSLGELYALLDARVGLIDGVVFSGGEPAMHEGLVDAAREVKARGFAVGVHTSGAFASRIRELAARDLVDWVGLDLKAPADMYPQIVARPGFRIDKVQKTWRVLREHGVAVEVRTTVTPVLAERIEDILDTYAHMWEMASDGSAAPAARCAPRKAELVLQRERPAPGSRKAGPMSASHPLWPAVFERTVARASSYGLTLSPPVRVRARS